MATALCVLAVLPGVATAQSVDPSAAVDAPAYLRAAGSFVLVLLFGGAFVYRYGEFVDDSVDVSMDRPAISLVYGVIAFALVVFLSGYVLSQVGRLGISSPAVLPVFGAALVGIFLVLSGLGYAVVGARLTELEGKRQPWRGLVVGAAVGALAWLLLPPLTGLMVYLAVAAVGIGGPVRRWIHASESVETKGDT